jgi:translation initiation factor IF-2
MKKRVHEIAKELNLPYKDLIKKFEDLGVTVKSHNSSVEEKDFEALKKLLEKEKVQAEVKPKTILRKRKEAAAPEQEVQLPVQAGAVEKQQATEEEVKASEKGVHGTAQPPVSKTEETTGTRTAAQGKAVKQETTQMREEPVHEAQVKKPAQTGHKGITAEEGTSQPEPSPVVQEQPPAGEAKEQETVESKKTAKPSVEILAPEKGKGKIKSEKGGAFIKKKILSRIKTDISEEIDLLQESKEDETILETVTTYPKKVQPQYKQQKHEKSPHGIPKAPVPPQKKIVKIDDKMTVSKLSQLMGVKASEIIKRLIALGVMAGINDTIDADTASLVIKDIGFEVTLKQEESPEAILEKEKDAPETLKARPPVVTVMGHVDHGKTTLLDAIRATKVAEGEAGGITQHIGAYKIMVDNKTVVFLDTPGHEAFTAMRARGAKVTDIVVLVVAADDGVMPQTIEAIDHAKAAGVPILVAINKIDKPEAQPQRVMQQLSDYGLVPEQWGGNTLYAMISAKKKTGINEMLELILLQAEMLELKVNPDKKAKATIIETRMEKGFGVVATAIIKEGTLKKGDYIVYGAHYNRVKTLLDDNGNVMPSAGPAMPVEIIGFESLPEVGDIILAVDDEDMAARITEHRVNQHQALEPTKKNKVSLEDIYKKIEEGSIKELPVLLKCDVMGSLGAIRDAIAGLSEENVKVKIIHAGIGGINESDVMLAAASDGIIIGFNVRPDAKAVQIANTQNIEIKTYTIIYELIDDIKKALTGLLKPVIKERSIGRAKVLEVFKVSKVGQIAGSMVIDGKVERGANVRVVRDGVVVYESRISSLKRFKEDVKDVDKGFECGIGIEKFNDLKKNDELEFYRMEKEGAAS